METNQQPELNPLFYFDYQELTPEEGPLLPEQQTDFDFIADLMKPMTAAGANSLTINDKEKEEGQRESDTWAFAMELPEAPLTSLNVWQEASADSLPQTMDRQQEFVQEFQPESLLLAEPKEGELELVLEMSEAKEEPQLVAESISEPLLAAELIDTDLIVTMINTNTNEANLIDIKEEAEMPVAQPETPVLPPKASGMLLRKRNYLVLVQVSEAEQALLVEDKTKPEKEQPDKTTQLIENFLDKEPKISSLKQGEDAGNWVEIGETSHSQSEVITESMAKIMLLQGNKEEAINIYEKLSLHFPEKSAYFAAHIQNIISNK